jgi:hypothetical protein
MKKTTICMLIAALLPAWGGTAPTVKEPDVPKAARASTALDIALGESKTIREA